MKKRARAKQEKFSHKKKNGKVIHVKRLKNQEKQKNVDNSWMIWSDEDLEKLFVYLRVYGYNIRKIAGIFKTKSLKQI